MKIGILTFVNTTNYGASLQAYALQQTIIREGHECEIIKYSCKKIEESHNPKKATGKNMLKRLLSPILKSIYRKNHDMFDGFEKKYCIFSTPCDEKSIVDVAKKYDRIIVGSDQVWNVDITGNDKSFFLNFVENDKKKCSYAASVGTRYFSRNSTEYEALIKDFDVISIREKGTAEQLRKKIGREDVVEDVDPTLLNYNHWTSFVKSSNDYGKYIFLYFLPENPTLYDAIRRFAKEKGCKLIHLKKSIVKRNGIRTINIASPIDFINLVAHAQYVVSGSFHALCFSLIFHKEFFVAPSPQKGRNVRLIDLLNIIGQEDRFIENTSFMFSQEKLDYTIIDKKIENAVESSMKTIKRICSDTEQERINNIG